MHELKVAISAVLEQLKNQPKRGGCSSACVICQQVAVSREVLQHLEQVYNAVREKL